MSIKLFPVLCNEKNMANYAYILNDSQSGQTIIIDAAESTPIIRKLEELNLTPNYILTTHHHFDHVGANETLKQKYNLQIFAPEKEFDKVPAADLPVIDGKTIRIGTMEIKPIAAAGHTRGHVLYHLPKEKMLFTGDVLFNCCIGGLFEGTPVEMFESLKKIKALPDDTLIFPGHEYTRSCLPPEAFNLPEFQAYLQKMFTREEGGTASATLAEEKQFNPYLKAQTLSEFLGQ